MELLQMLMVFILAIFVGFEIITKVPPLLHTPLMSGSNAISGITIVGAILACGISITDQAADITVIGNYTLSHILGFIALSLATINVIGGFMVTHRMLAKFKRKD